MYSAIKRVAGRIAPAAIVSSPLLSAAPPASHQPDAISTPDTKDSGTGPTQLHIVQSQVLFRHGARVPIHKHHNIDTTHGFTDLADSHLQRFPKPILKDAVTEDPFTLSIRPGPTFGEKGAPSGALTGKGVKQMLELGRTLRRRYVDGESGDARVHTKLLTGNPDEIYTRSTAIERTVQSAQCVYTGLRGEKSEAVPIHTKPSRDEYLYPNTSHCAQLAHIFKMGRDRFAQSPVPEIAGLCKELQDAFADVDSNGRVNFIRLKDILSAKVAEHQKLPEGIDMDRVEAIERAATHQLVAFLEGNGSDAHLQTGVRLGIGRILNEMRLRMEQTAFAHALATQNVPHPPPLPEWCTPKAYADLLVELAEQKEWRAGAEKRLCLFSSHDSTLIPIMMALGIHEPGHWPPFASNLSIEVFATHPWNTGDAAADAHAKDNGNGHNHNHAHHHLKTPAIVLAALATAAAGDDIPVTAVELAAEMDGKEDDSQESEDEKEGIIERMADAVDRVAHPLLSAVGKAESATAMGLAKASHLVSDTVEQAKHLVHVAEDTALDALHKVEDTAVRIEEAVVSTMEKLVTPSTDSEGRFERPEDLDNKEDESHVETATVVGRLSGKDAEKLGKLVPKLQKVLDKIQAYPEGEAPKKLQKKQAKLSKKINDILNSINDEVEEPVEKPKKSLEKLKQKIAKLQKKLEEGKDNAKQTEKTKKKLSKLQKKFPELFTSHADATATSTAAAPVAEETTSVAAPVSTPAVSTPDVSQLQSTLAEQSAKLSALAELQDQLLQLLEQQSLEAGLALAQAEAAITHKTAEADSTEARAKEAVQLATAAAQAAQRSNSELQQQTTLLLSAEKQQHAATLEKLGLALARSEIFAQQQLQANETAMRDVRALLASAQAEAHKNATVAADSIEKAALALATSERERSNDIAALNDSIHSIRRELRSSLSDSLQLVKAETEARLTTSINELQRQLAQQQAATTEALRDITHRTSSDAASIHDDVRRAADAHATMVTTVQSLAREVKNFLSDAAAAITSIVTSAKASEEAARNTTQMHAAGVEEAATVAMSAALLASQDAHAAHAMAHSASNHAAHALQSAETAQMEAATMTQKMEKLLQQVSTLYEDFSHKLSHQQTTSAARESELEAELLVSKRVSEARSEALRAVAVASDQLRLAQHIAAEGVRQAEVVKARAAAEATASLHASELIKRRVEQEAQHATQLADQAAAAAAKVVQGMQEKLSAALKELSEQEETARKATEDKISGLLARAEAARKEAEEHISVADATVFELTSLVSAVEGKCIAEIAAVQQVLKEKIALAVAQAEVDIQNAVARAKQVETEMEAEMANQWAYHESFQSALYAEALEASQEAKRQQANLRETAEQVEAQTQEMALNALLSVSAMREEELTTRQQVDRELSLLSETVEKQRALAAQAQQEAATAIQRANRERRQAETALELAKARLDEVKAASEGMNAVPAKKITETHSTASAPAATPTPSPAPMPAATQPSTAPADPYAAELESFSAHVKEDAKQYNSKLAAARRLEADPKYQEQQRYERILSAIFARHKMEDTPANRQLVADFEREFPVATDAHVRLLGAAHPLVAQEAASKHIYATDVDAKTGRKLTPEELYARMVQDATKREKAHSQSVDTIVPLPQPSVVADAKPDATRSHEDVATSQAVAPQDEYLSALAGLSALHGAPPSARADAVPAAPTPAAETQTTTAASTAAATQTPASSSGPDDYLALLVGHTHAHPQQATTTGQAPQASSELVQPPHTSLSAAEKAYLEASSSPVRRRALMAHAPISAHANTAATATDHDNHHTTPPLRYFVRVSYNGRALILPGQADEFCPMEDFRALISKYIPDNFEEECSVTVRNAAGEQTVLAATGEHVAFDTIAADPQDVREVANKHK